MSITSFRSDPARIAKEVEISTFSGQYFLNTPGQGANMPYLEDVHIRLQSWGANFDAKRFLDIEDDLRGTSRKLTADGSHYRYNIRSSNAAANSQYPTMQPFVDETRASQPAWLLRDLDRKYSRWEQPWLNPQSHVEREFEWSTNSKRLARQEYKTHSMVLSDDDLANHIEGLLPNMP